MGGAKGEGDAPRPRLLLDTSCEKRTDVACAGRSEVAASKLRSSDIVSPGNHEKGVTHDTP